MSLKTLPESSRPWRRLACMALCAASLPAWSQSAGSTAGSAAAPAAAAPTLVAALDSDPNRLGWMQGFPAAGQADHAYAGRRQVPAQSLAVLAYP